MAFIRGIDGKLYDYAKYEDEIKPYLKSQMRKEDTQKSDLKCGSCYHHLTVAEKRVCMGLCPKCRRNSLIVC